VQNTAHATVFCSLVHLLKKEAKTKVFNLKERKFTCQAFIQMASTRKIVEKYNNKRKDAILI
jgi:hypothetical protein